MNFKHIPPILLLTLGMGLSLTPSFSYENNDKIVKSEGVFISECTDNDGPIFYPADYASDISDEPNYSTQNTITFSPMNYHYASDYYRGDSVKVAVIDSGLNYTHEDFILGGNQIIQGHSRAIDNTSGNWLYYQFSSGYQNKLTDSLGHGTNVASVIASQINEVGCAGIAPNIDLYVYKVTNTSNGYEWTAINNALQYCIDEGIDVINMSFQAYEHAVEYNGSSMGASTGCSSVMVNKLNACYDAGITLVAAAGNFNTSEPSYPASNNHVISVGSLARASTTTKAGFSNTYGIDLVAPGYVYVADKGTNTAYKETQGTSFSAPIVTAAIALYKQKNPTATPDQIEAALYASCDDLKQSWAGHGRLNIDRFLNVENNIPTEIVVNNPEIVNEELELEVGDTFDLDWTVNGRGTFDNSVSFYPLDDNGTVSVSSSGHITALKEGSDYVVIESDVDSSVYTSIYVTVTEKADPPHEWRLVTSTSELSATSKYIFVNSGTTYVSGALDGAYLTAVSGATFSQDKNTITALPEGARPFTLGGSSGAWTFTMDAESKLLYADATNLYLTSGSGKYSTYTISFSGNNATVKANDSYRIYYNTSSPRFKTYSSSQGDIRLYKKTYVDNTKELDRISLAGMTTTYNVGDTFSFNGTCTAYWIGDVSGETSGTVSPTSVSSPDMSTAGVKQVTVTYTDTYGTKTANYNITVNNVLATSLTINKSSDTLEVDDTLVLNATILPNNTTNKTLIWSTSNSGVASISSTSGSSITVTAVAVGDATITVATTDGSNLSRTCSITVTPKVVLTSIVVSGYNETVAYKNEYSLGNYVVTAHYSNGTSRAVTGEEEISGAVNTSIIGRHILYISYTEKNVTKETEAYIKVTNNGASGNVGTTREVDASVSSTFTDKSWGDVNSLWNKGKDGNGMGNGGIQVTTGTSGANATTKATYYKISSVTVAYCTNDKSGAGTIKAKVGTGTEKTFSVTSPGSGGGGTTHKTTTFNFSPAETGKLKITVNCTTNSVYIISVTINYKDSEDYPATPTDQAKAWATYFLNCTKPYCNISGQGSDVSSINSSWSSLSLEYGYMVDAAKDAFVESNDETIVEARTLYSLLIRKYLVVFEDNFVEDSSGTKPYNAYNFSPEVVTKENSISIVIIMSSICALSLTSYILLKKRKHD